MNLSEAYKILEIPEGSSVDEAKVSFRKKAAALHPDNKDTGNEEKFKELNAAWQLINNPPAQNPFGNQGGVPFDMQDIFRGGFPGGFNFEQIFINMGGENRAPKVKVQISFSESCLGTNKDISITRNVKCSCVGSCEKCKGKGIVSETNTYKISIPAGVDNGASLRLDNAGDYNPRTRRNDGAFIQVFVSGEENMQRMNMDIVSNINLTLLSLTIYNFTFTVVIK
jgi:molecular chaperone DnaJ